jgi:hypothetical protein
VASAIGILLSLPAVGVAGPPLICHPFETGTEALLAWGPGPGWNSPDPRYDLRRLTGDTLRLLTPGTAVIARMENMRRATIYAARDPRVADELLAALLARALATVAAGTPDPDALFDAGYLIESYRQAAHLNRDRLFPVRVRPSWTRWGDPALDGYALIARALALAGPRPEMEFAASLVKGGERSADHRRRAEAGARPGSLLARNLARGL